MTAAGARALGVLALALAALAPARARAERPAPPGASSAGDAAAAAEPARTAAEPARTAAEPARTAADPAAAAGPAPDPELAADDDGEATGLRATVRARRPSAGAAGTAVSAEEARRVPGAAGDALTAVRSAPGVTRPPSGSAALVIWGAAPAESRVYVDDVPIPALFHHGGVRSVLADGLVGGFDLLPAAFPAAYGRALGGVVPIRTAPEPPEGHHARLAADPLDLSAAASVSRTDAEGRTSLWAGGRKGLVDRVLPAIAPRIEEVVTLPDYTDWAARLVTSGGGDRTELLLLGAREVVELRLPSPDPSERRGEQGSSEFHRLALRHLRSLPGGAQLTLTAWVGLDLEGEQARFGPVPTGSSREVRRFGIRAARLERLSDLAELTLGVDLEGSRSALTRTGSLGSPRREGDPGVFGQPPPDAVADDLWRVEQVGVAPYAELALALLDERLRLVPGLRLEPSIVSGSRALPPAGGGVDVGYSRYDVAVEPRLRAEGDLTPRLTLLAAAGLHRQPAEPADLSAVSGNAALAAPRARHLLAGGRLRFLDATSVELTGFARQESGLAARSAREPPQLGAALSGTGEGRVLGAQLLLRQGSWRGLEGSLGYTLSSSERRDGPGAAWRRFDLDQPHALTALASLALGRFTFGARLLATSGLPRTAVTGTYYDTAADRFRPLLGEVNGERLPPFVELDLRAERAFRLGAGRLTLYAEGLNVTGRDNAEELVYSADFTTSRPRTGLPAVGLLGARIDL